MESESGEQKEEEKKKCVLCYNASMRHLDCYSWSWPCLPSPPCLICKGRSAVRSLAAHEQRNHIFLRARNLALSLSSQVSTEANDNELHFHLQSSHSIPLINFTLQLQSAQFLEDVV